VKRGIWQVRHSSAGDAVPSRCICIGLKDVHGLFIVLLPTRMRQVQAEVVEGVTSFM